MASQFKSAQAAFCNLIQSNSKSKMNDNSYPVSPSNIVNNTDMLNENSDEQSQHKDSTINIDMNPSHI